MNASLRDAHSVSRPEPDADPRLCDKVAHSVRRYLIDMDNTECREGLYSVVLNEIERPLLAEVMAWHEGNQSRAAHTLGINRATLRKKLLHHGLI